jgi:HEAT repeat protein
MADPKRKLFFGLFIFPLVIVLGMAALLCSVVFLTHEEETPESLITAIKTGSPSKRWQKAFELSNELNRQPEMIRGTGVMKEIIHILNDSVHYDAKTRGYMAMALSRFQEPEALEAIRKRLSEESEEVQLYLLWALGNLGGPEDAKVLEPFLKSENADLRKMAVYVLGVLGDKKMISEIKPLLNDPVADVSWNAALSLARLGDDSGWDLLMGMLDRKMLASNYQLPKDQIEKVMVNAIRGVTLLDREEAKPLLDSLARTDESLAVRQAAIEATRYEKKEGVLNG